MKDTNIKIKTQYEPNGVQAALSSLKSLDTQVSSVGKTFDILKNVTIYSTLAIGFKKVADVALDCANEFGKAQQNYLALNVAVGGNQTRFNDLKNLIDSLSQKTLESKDNVQKLVTQLVVLGNSDEQVKKISTAAVTLSKVAPTSVGSMSSALALLNKSLDGSDSKIETLVDGMPKFTKAQLEAGAAVDYINNKFGAASDAMDGSYLQSLHNMNQAFDEVKETIGATVAQAIQPLLVTIKDVFLYFNNHKAELIGTLTAISAIIGVITIAIGHPILGAIELVGTGVGSLILLAGNLKILWLEIQEVVLGAAKGIQDTVSDIGNTFIDLVNVALSAYNKVAGLLKQKPISMLAYIDIAKVTGLSSAIASIDSQIKNEKDKLAKGAANYANGGSGVGNGGNNTDYSQLTKAITDGITNVTWDTIALNNQAAKGMDDDQYNALKYYSNPSNFIGKDSGATAQTYDATSVDKFAGKLREAGTSLSSIPVVGNLVKSGLYGLANALTGTQDIINQSINAFNSSSNIVGRKNDNGTVSGGSELGNVLSGLGGFGSMIANVAGPLGSLIGSVSSISQILNPLQTIMTAMMSVLEPVINTLLTPLVGILNIVGQTIGKAIAPILQALTPIITAVANIFVYIYNYALRPFANGVIWVGNAIHNAISGFLNALASLSIWGWHPFGALGGQSIVDLTSGFLDAIDLTTVQAAGASTTTSSSSTGSSASYSGPSTVNFTFWEYGTYVDSDSWIKSKARLIKAALQEDAVLGY